MCFHGLAFLRPVIKPRSMQQQLKFEFNSAQSSNGPNARRLRCDMYAAEYIQIGLRAPYDFNWRGSQFYLALHDIRKRDGETVLGGNFRGNATDIRNKLTFAPTDCSIS